ncbi:MAG: hypothetical protein NHF95_00035 [Candidatus Shikimatogenerans sp. JK-2022]|nr:hypothetical protein [Candidatus Shikimatogenerans bostrichidophilus]
MEFTCVNSPPYTFEYEYPFTLLLTDVKLNSTDAQNKPCLVTPEITGSVSSDAKFFVATGVLAMLYAIAIVLVYVKFDNLYRTNSQVPLCVSHFLLICFKSC